jgi:hypothetical protein
MDIRVVAIRALTLCAVEFARRVLDTTVQELNQISRRSRRRSRCGHKPLLRIIRGGRQ